MAAEVIGVETDASGDGKVSTISLSDGSRLLIATSADGSVRRVLETGPVRHVMLAAWAPRTGVRVGDRIELGSRISIADDEGVFNDDPQPSAVVDDVPGSDWNALSGVEKGLFTALKNDSELLNLMDQFSEQFERNEAERAQRSDRVWQSIDAYWHGREDQRPRGK